MDIFANLFAPIPNDYHLCAMCSKPIFNSVSIANECQCSARCGYCKQLFCREPQHVKIADEHAFDDGED